MPPTKNQIAATMTSSEAARAGVLSAAQAVEAVTVMTKKQSGFTRKMVPTGLPTEPKLYIYSVSEYGAKGGDMIDIGPGFPKYELEPCPEDAEYGEPLVLDPIHFFEEVKVDVTEHTFTSGQQIVDAIMRRGPGMNASWDRGKIGWFVSSQYPPKPEEVQRAVEVYTAECKRLLADGQRYFVANHLNEINETHYRAAKYLKQKVDWNKPVSKMIDCPGCQEPVKAGAILHAVPYCGYVFDWKRAIENNMRTIEQAPLKLRKALEQQLEAQ